MPSRLVILATTVAAALLFAELCAQGQQQQINEEKAAEVKANYVLNFVRYTEWPAGSFASAESPLVLTIVGEDRMSHYLEALAAALPNRSINSRKFEIRYLFYPTPLAGQETLTAEQMNEFQRQLRESHAVYTAASEWSNAQSIISMLKGAAVLSIGDTPRFAEQGGMLGLTLRDNTIKFDANIDAIEASQLKISSKVLRLARIVRKENSLP